jgi:hypothetical protein
VPRAYAVVACTINGINKYRFFCRHTAGRQPDQQTRVIVKNV